LVKRGDMKKEGYAGDAAELARTSSFGRGSEKEEKGRRKVFTGRRKSLNVPEKKKVSEGGPLRARLRRN